MGLKKKKGKRSVPAFKVTVPSYVRLCFFPGHKNGPFVHGIIGIINIHHLKMLLCFADTQTTVFAFQATARHPEAQFLAAVLESLLVRCCLWSYGRGMGGKGGSQPSTCLFSMHCGCHAAGGAAVVFIAVPGATRPARKGPSREEMWQAAHGPLWSCNFSTQSSFYTDHSSTPYFIMLDAFHPVLHPGGKERALASRLPRCKGSAVLGCTGVSSPCSWRQPDSSLETTKSSRCCGVRMCVR